MKRFVEASLLALSVLLLSACRSSEDSTQSADENSNRVSTSTLSFELPEGVSEVDDYEPTDGWTESYSDNPDEPTIVMRVSDESEKVSGIEIIGTGISPSQVDEIRDSLEYAT